MPGRRYVPRRPLPTRRLSNLHRTLPVTVIAALAAVAGCIEAPNVTDDALDAAAGTLGGTLGWNLTDCHAMLGLVPVDAAKIAAHVPEGFRVLPPSETGFPALADAAGSGVLGFETFQCAEAAGLDAAVADASYGSFFTFVEPPEDLKDPLVDFAYFVKWDAVIADDGLRAALAAAGAPAHEGTSTFNMPVEPPTGPVPSDFSGQLYFGDGTVSFAINGGPRAPADALAGTFAEFTETPNGLVKWVATASATAMQQSAGYVKVNGDSVAMDILGTDRVPAVVLHAVGMTFENATVVLPAAPVPPATADEA